ncbi:hypothetical protein CYLTODRAFT_84744 [Cylindrobasidium torrendii FP15055 ss-10]|uniref:Uncharacterized protein n=1 Tax=Cylindrobasidium torrendii FP15055 ss-10 TaxID=1314674 RepID=A0A0D7B2F0_9AGAR|nr:hypothetical protein CYLTODRAFT_84744 [Cylindrobasidium torrendii FP15055 ss-10]
MHFNMTGERSRSGIPCTVLGLLYAFTHLWPKATFFFKRVDLWAPAVYRPRLGGWRAGLGRSHTLESSLATTIPGVRILRSIWWDSDALEPGTRTVGAITLRRTVDIGNEHAFGKAKPVWADTTEDNPDGE